ncbi:MAG: hypothetical protein K2G55_01550 [Lachnospiraceae bacterium]|nr:hypothetical protein [Lachnospiraceae bacterium]MDE7205002.1 hypothetical protein [Lachnospiraceae bacterium]
MFTYLIILGTGAITFVIEKKLTRTQNEKSIFMLFEYLMYTVINLASTYLILSPIGRITIVQANTGMYEVVYGSSAIVISFVLAIVWGLTFAFINKNVKCSIKIDEQ